MKMLKSISVNWPKAVLVCAALAMMLFLSNCSSDSNSTPMPTQSIVQIAQGNSNLSSLVTALTKYPDLVSTLSGSGKFTVFAPTNQAFTNILAAIGQTSIDNVPEDVLKNILQYHVVTSGALKAADLKAQNYTASDNEAITVTLTGGVKLNGTVSVVTADVLASNGVVHVIDGVLVPPSVTPIVGTIVAPAYFNKNFTTLIAAVKAADPSVLTTLLSSSQKTLFAPTNDAFTAAGITTLPNAATLNAVLTYHVLGAKVLSSQLPTNTAPANSRVVTANGDSIFISNRGTAGVFINGNSKVTAVDIAGSNGVVHVIDRVLLPPTKTIAEIAVAQSTATTPQFTQLVAALQRTSGKSVDLLAAAGNSDLTLTVFAPTDAAFQALYTALGVGGINDIDLATLTKVLSYHIYAHSRVFSSDLVNGSVPMFNNSGSVTLSATNKTVTDNSGSAAANIVATDILGKNGVIHVIDRVLIPQ